ncbi:MAG: hypothetical protein KAQ89_00190 [Planctomycetes bacterium]|nr:hypothetical protein [Planctomycetota bacterium]
MNEKPKSEFTIKHAPPTRQSEKTFNYLMYSQKLGTITDSPWQRCSGSSLADARKKVGDDLVEDPGMPKMIYLPSEVQAAELRAEMMDKKYEDIVVTLIVKSRFADPAGIIRIESLPYSQLAGRITTLKRIAEKNNGHVFVVSVYSEETKQEFWWNDMELDIKPRLPGYGKDTDRKRTAYRNSASGV